MKRFCENEEVPTLPVPGMNDSVEEVRRLASVGREISLHPHRSRKTAVPQTLLFIRYRGAGCLMESKDDFFMQILDGVEGQARLSGFNLQILISAESNGGQKAADKRDSRSCRNNIFLLDAQAQKILAFRKGGLGLY